MPSILTRMVLFLSGYFPLLLIFTIRYYEQYGFIAVIPAAVGILAVFGLIAFLNWVKQTNPTELKVQGVQRKDAEVIAYIFAYVFPFLGFDPSDVSSAIGLAVFFVVLMVLNVTANMIHINPMLSVFGYHLYEVVSEGDTITLITRRARLFRESSLDAVLVGDDVYMER